MTQSQKYIETLREEYIENHTRQQERDELIVENNIEKRDIKGYHGRELLELLQNADDAYQKSIDLGAKPDCELIVTIKYIQNILTIANTGTFFDKDGIKAIVQGNNSPKTGKYIGHKGTGFRSILNWAQNVKIFSGDYAVEFSKEFAKETEKHILIYSLELFLKIVKSRDLADIKDGTIDELEKITKLVHDILGQFSDRNEATRSDTNVTNNFILQRKVSENVSNIGNNMGSTAGNS